MLLCFSINGGNIVKSMFLVCAVFTILPASAFTQSVFLNDNFEGDLSEWESLGYGVVVADPINPGNHVLSFTNTAAAGNMFTPAYECLPGATYVFSFRYLGNAGGEDTGGYIWLYDPADPYSPENPVWGTQPENSMFELIDDGQWHGYQLMFQCSDYFDPFSGQIKLTVEDWNGNGASGWGPPDLAGDAFFDDIALYQVIPVVQWTVESGGNGHWYEYVPVEHCSWTEAASLASQRSYQGFVGYLATITSAEENEFWWNSLGQPSFVWLGGRQSESGAEPAGGWQWITGEEWGYENWGAGQPDDGFLEYDFLGNRDSGPEWYDRLESPTRAFGYIVEYSESVIQNDVMSWGDVKSVYR